jgi:hypothetical protein
MEEPWWKEGIRKAFIAVHEEMQEKYKTEPLPGMYTIHHGNIYKYGKQITMKEVVDTLNKDCKVTQNIRHSLNL